MQFDDTKLQRNWIVYLTQMCQNELLRDQKIQYPVFSKKSDSRNRKQTGQLTSKVLAKVNVGLKNKIYFITEGFF